MFFFFTLAKPGAPSITLSEDDIHDTSLTIRWSEPADNGGSPILTYRVVLLKKVSDDVTDSSTTSLSVEGLGRDNKYIVNVFARNFVFEGPAGIKIVQTKSDGENIQ